MKRFKSFLTEMHLITVGEHPDSGDLIYAHTDDYRDERRLSSVRSSTVTFPSRFPPGAPGSLLSDHEHGDRHMRKLNNLGEIDPKA